MSTFLKLISKQWSSQLHNWMVQNHLRSAFTSFEILQCETKATNKYSTDLFPVLASHK